MAKHLMARLDRVADTLGLHDAPGLTLADWKRLTAALLSGEMTPEEERAEHRRLLLASGLTQAEADARLSQRDEQLRLAAETLALFEGTDTEQAGLPTSDHTDDAETP